MKLAYVAGLYNCKGTQGKFRTFLNVLQARKVARELWRMGYSAICPHSNTAFFDDVVSWEQFMNGDFLMLNKCDIIVMVPNWYMSTGANLEKRFAEKTGIPVRYWGADNDKLLAEV